MASLRDILRDSQQDFGRQDSWRSRQDFGRRDLEMSAGFWPPRSKKLGGQNPAENLDEISVKILYGGGCDSLV